MPLSSSIDANLGERVERLLGLRPDDVDTGDRPALAAL